MQRLKIINNSIQSQIVIERLKEMGYISDFLAFHNNYELLGIKKERIYLFCAFPILLGTNEDTEEVAFGKKNEELNLEKEFKSELNQAYHQSKDENEIWYADALKEQKRNPNKKVTIKPIGVTQKWKAFPIDNLLHIPSKSIKNYFGEKIAL
jgi:hypothetical protein